MEILIGDIVVYYGFYYDYIGIIIDIFNDGFCAIKTENGKIMIVDTYYIDFLA